MRGTLYRSSMHSRKPYRTRPDRETASERGRGRTSMSRVPQGTFQAVALIDTVAHPVAWDFYDDFPIDPVQPTPQTIAVVARHRVDNMTWQSLLSAIRQHVPNGGSALVVSHGTSRGIFIPMFPGGPFSDA